MKWSLYKKRNVLRIKLLNKLFADLVKIMVVIAVLSLSGLLDSFFQTPGFKTKYVSFIACLAVVFGVAWYLTLPAGTAE